MQGEAPSLTLVAIRSSFTRMTWNQWVRTAHRLWLILPSNLDRTACRCRRGWGFYIASINQFNTATSSFPIRWRHTAIRKPSWSFWLFHAFWDGGIFVALLPQYSLKFGVLVLHPESSISEYGLKLFGGSSNPQGGNRRKSNHNYPPRKDRPSWKKLMLLTK